MMQIYRCPHCLTKYVVVQSRKIALIPVEVTSITPEELENGINVFDRTRHISHCKNCDGRWKDWPEVQKQFKKPEAKI